MFTGGGRTFAARPRDFRQKVNRKMYRGAMRSVLSELIRQDRLLLTEEFGVSAPKTKELKSKLKELSVENVLIVVEGFDMNLSLAARNFGHWEGREAARVDPVQLSPCHSHQLIDTTAHPSRPSRLWAQASRKALAAL